MPQLSDFDYYLPAERIAQEPLAVRDQSKLLVLERPTGAISHHVFADMLGFLRKGDILVVNNSRVIPARLYGQKRSTGGRVELLLLEELANGRWKALVGGRKLVEGVVIVLEDGAGNPSHITAEVTAVLDGPQREISFSQPTAEWLDGFGHMPLPPYIHTPLTDPERYQTIYSRPAGSSAAPTAGLHFTPDLLFALREKGVLFETVTLHVGLDTFKPVEAAEISQHTIHSEWATLTPEAAQRINEAKLAGGRLVAVGTTSMRTLETAALRSAGITGSLQTITQRDISGETSNMCPWKPVSAFEGPTDLYVYPGYRFRAVDALITNFHIPQSTLLMLVSAFAGRENIFAAYESALQNDYRFLSFGDAMFIK
ncbi:MAG: tRNA preQ1(34) S-adenosylmethionine ribosyltransferase-isomerase QueA [Chloroflexi bacterium]|nr:tRNA preQ1(34) S-adenosylmethionine ribosyltransferase-isomerase QueA [Chloroflexota bacterium]